MFGKYYQDELAYLRELGREFAQAYPALAPMLADWRVTRPRVFIYGAGLHSRMLLGLMPELGPYVGGFIDRRPMSSFLGKPCIRPEAFDNHLADVILYSSREHEEEMYQTRLKQLHITKIVRIRFFQVINFVELHNYRTELVAVAFIIAIIF